MITKDIIKVLESLQDIFDCSYLDKNPELFSNKNEKVIGEFKVETPENIWIDEFFVLRGKMYSFKRRNDSKININCYSKFQSKHIRFEEYEKWLYGEEYQRECDKCLLGSINHEMNLQKVKKNEHYLYSMINHVI